jgi:hypothetical protein
MILQTASQNKGFRHKKQNSHQQELDDGKKIVTSRSFSKMHLRFSESVKSSDRWDSHKNYNIEAIVKQHK